MNILDHVRAITVSYGQVHGKAKDYPYHQPAEYRLHRTKAGRLCWLYLGHRGTARRALHLAEADAEALAGAERNLFLPGLRQWNDVTAEQICKICRALDYDRKLAKANH